MDRPSRWEKIKEIVGTALERDPAHRAAYLDEACAQNPTLRPEIESLISAYDQPEELTSLNHPWLARYLPQRSPSSPSALTACSKFLVKVAWVRCGLPNRPLPFAVRSP